MTEIYLLRHAETDANKNYIVQGRMDNPINETGVKQAIDTGKYLKQLNIDFDLVISSPLKRAYKTATLINHGMVRSRPIIIDRNLIERNFGDYDGRKITDDYYDLTRNGLIPNMETDEVLEERVIKTLTAIAEKYDNKRLLIITHSHVIKALLHKFVEGFTYMTFLHNCSLNKIQYENGEFKILEYNIDPLDITKA
ncbi:MAG: histidine phosphatase family protein [Candidatus Izemoplasmatales bacterium]